MRWLGIILGLAIFASGQLHAAERALTPTIPKALEKVEKGHAELMRRQHMDLMTHKRDETVHKGVRTSENSLKACISCHAVFGPNKQPVSIKSEKHFCRTCHDYAAVKIDCFQCHSSKPEPSKPEPAKR